jgi:hypothetical protein
MATVSFPLIAASKAPLSLDISSSDKTELSTSLKCLPFISPKLAMPVPRRNVSEA